MIDAHSRHHAATKQTPKALTMTVSTYTYDAGDLLHSPNSYRYTQIHGPQFIDDWASQRAAAMDELSGGWTELDLQSQGIISRITKKPLGESNGTGYSDTSISSEMIAWSERILTEAVDTGAADTYDLVNAMLIQESRLEAVDLAEQKLALEAMRRNFECSRILHSRYERRLRHGLSISTDLALYTRTAALFGVCSGGEVDLLTLNVLLKLNDVLVANRSTISDPADRAYSHLALAMEASRVHMLRNRGTE